MLNNNCCDFEIPITQNDFCKLTYPISYIRTMFAKFKRTDSDCYFKDVNSDFKLHINGFTDKVKFDGRRKYIVEWSRDYVNIKQHNWNV